MRKRSQRLWLIGAAGLLGVGAIVLAATGLKDTVAYFYAPSELVVKNAVKPGQSVRVGGLVEKKSITHGANGAVLFRITDGTNAVPVTFSGLLPDLFKEDQGVVAEGKMGADGELVAKRVLARHDETYMPKEVYDAFRKKAEMEAAAAAAAGKAPGT
jgi:cytochrome c-type biogenesis protein CcmE